MIKSMTGYGYGVIECESCQVNVEVKSLNSRFIEYKIRGYNISPETDKKVKNSLKKNLERGYIQIKVEIISKELNDLVFNKNRFESIMKVVGKVNSEYDKKIDVNRIINFNDLIINNDNGLVIDESKILQALKFAILDLNQMRILEGKEIEVDLYNRINKLKKFLKEIKITSNKYFDVMQERLTKKIKSVLKNHEIDKSRLIQEVALITEKNDITEEITRCEIHFNQLLEYLNKNEPIGKKINFFLQELNREINTIGSKCLQIPITMNIVEMKAELEKIREQIQNVL